MLGQVLDHVIHCQHCLSNPNIVLAAAPKLRQQVLARALSSQTQHCTGKCCLVLCRSLVAAGTIMHSSRETKSMVQDLGIIELAQRFRTSSSVRIAGIAQELCQLYNKL